MIIRLSLALVCSTLLSIGGAFAQNPSPSPYSAPAKLPAAETDPNAPLDGNYVLTLTCADKKGGPELSILVATQTFGMYNAEPNGVNGVHDLTFNARLIPQRDDTFLLTYELTTDARRAIAKAAVLIRPGEPVQLIKNGDLFYNVRLDRYHPAAAKPDAPRP